MNRREWMGAFGAAGAGALACSAEARAAGHDSAKGMEAGTTTPLGSPHAHFCGIHIAKRDPKFQIIVQHYCAAHAGEAGSDPMFQCVLFDSHDKNAKLLGVEYIVSDAEFRRLPDEEKKYWHPHTYEVMAGGLIAPGMQADEELEFMKHILLTWGKTWHTWPDPSSPVPVGAPLLMWSVTGDGQLSDAIVADRDRQFHVSAKQIRESRRKSIGYEVPKVSLPKSVDQVGRQWTDEGEDRPTRAR